MPAKYHIHTYPVAPRYRPIGKLGIVDWREDCSSCHNCVKKSCIYGFWRDEIDTLHKETGYLDYIYQCKGCLTCIQSCTKNILTRTVNPEYERLGDEYFTSEIILSSWFQAESGKVPVSGCGYHGPFSGKGFDSMWTDMSEIVRPTRDGIHGREYISTSIDIGRKLPHLTFTDGEMNISPPPLIEIPLPIIFNVVPENFNRGSIFSSFVKAAYKLGTLAVLEEENLPDKREDANNSIIPYIKGADLSTAHTTAPLVLIDDSDDFESRRDKLKKKNPEQIVAVRIKANADAARRTVELARQGAEVIYLVFNPHGREFEADKPRHVRDALRHVHGELTKAGIRDEITLVVAGGVALPEHLAKTILCGADLVAIDLPLMIAIECRLCKECARGEACPVTLEEAEEDFAIQRIVNLMGAWQNQLLELMGAMGIREVRRLRGETGRCMFFEDLEKQTFGRLFGKRKVCEI